MRSYADQKKIIVQLEIETELYRKGMKAKPLSRGELDAIVDAIDTISQADKLRPLITAIYDAARVHREFCGHCNSVANVIEDAKLLAPKSSVYTPL